ncbi:hypothetical protein REPUB_Repub08aG0197500 [Reevesia pubescens]
MLFNRRKDPEGISEAPQTGVRGHLARLEFKRRLERDAEAREAFEQHLREEEERRRALRESREIPDTPAELIEYFLDTEAQEIEFEIARLRQRLVVSTFYLDTEDRLIRLEALPMALQEGIGIYFNQTTYG